jgi:superoxide oxidase
MGPAGADRPPARPIEPNLDRGPDKFGWIRTLLVGIFSPPDGRSEMSAGTELQTRSNATSPVESFDRVLKAVHWSTLLLIAAAYAAVWASHIAATKDQHALLVQLHRSIGVTICALTVFRLAWRWNARIPPLPAELPLFQKLAARATEYVLYALLLLQPAIGLLNTNAQGQRVDFYFLGELPPVVGPDKVLVKQAMAAHEFVAYLILALVALHAAAALFHHFVRHDGVLNAMLPSRRR